MTCVNNNDNDTYIIFLYIKTLISYEKNVYCIHLYAFADLGGAFSQKLLQKGSFFAILRVAIPLSNKEVERLQPTHPAPPPPFKHFYTSLCKCCKSIILCILWMAIFSWIPIFVDWRKMMHSWGIFLAMIFSFIIKPENTISLVLKFV